MKWIVFFMSVELDDLVVFPAFEYALADDVDDIGLGDAAEPEYRGFGVGGFQVQVHEFEELEQEGFGDAVVFDPEQFNGVNLFKEEPFGDTDILRGNKIDNPPDKYIAV